MPARRLAKRSLLLPEATEGIPNEFCRALRFANSRSRRLIGSFFGSSATGEGFVAAGGGDGFLAPAGGSAFRFMGAAFFGVQADIVRCGPSTSWDLRTSACSGSHGPRVPWS